MAKVCCVCGNKISMLDYAYDLAEKHTEFKVCDQCHIHINNFTYGASIEALERGKAYFLPYLQSANIDSEVRSIINSKMEKSYEIEKEKRSKQIYLDKLKELRNTTVKKDYEILLKNIETFKENSLMTSGYDFSGYNIVAYHGVVSGEVVLGTGFLAELSAGFSDFFGVESDEFAEKLKSAKNAAKVKLMEEAIGVGGNAIIGIDFDYVVFGSNIIGVCANGTAVEVEKIG